MTVGDSRIDGRLPSPYFAPGSASFTEFLSEQAPELLPSRRPLPGGPVDVPHGTTIVAATYPGGVVMAGDRRATMGNVIAQRDIEKVFPADEFSCVGIAGTAGLAIEVVRLFQVELEHYEKIEGTSLSLDGKANRLAALVRGNLGHGHAGTGRRPAVRRLRPRAPAAAGSSPTTSPAGGTRSTRSTRSAPDRCSPAGR